MMRRAILIEIAASSYEVEMPDYHEVRAVVDRIFLLFDECVERTAFLASMRGIGVPRDPLPRLASDGDAHRRLPRRKVRPARREHWGSTTEIASRVARIVPAVLM